MLNLRKNGQKASVRTRRIINKCGPEFVLHENQKKPGWILIKSTKTGWFGWLPQDEVILGDSHVQG